MNVHTYSYWQIRRYLRMNGMDIRNVTPYKGTRYGRPAQYMLYDMDDGKDICVTTLNRLRKLLYQYDYPIDE